MGGVLGVVFPDGGGLNVQTRSVQLQNGGQLLVGDVLQEGVGRQVGDTAQVKFISEADDRPGILIRPAGGNVVAGTHLLHQKGGGDVRVQAPVYHEQLEVVLPGGGEIRQGIDEGAAGGYGEVVGVGNAQLPALLHQGVKSLVAVGVGLGDVVVEHQVIGSPVAHQHIAVAVENIAPGGTDGGDGTINLGIVGVAFGINNLKLVEPERVKKQDKREQSQKHTSTEAAYSFHVLPPMRPVLLIRE